MRGKAQASAAKELEEHKQALAEERQARAQLEQLNDDRASRIAALKEQCARHSPTTLGLHTSWGGGQFRHPDFPESLGNPGNP